MSGGTWAVLPVKPLRGALRRLTPALDAPVRRELQVAMLTDVLAACAGARELAGVMVVTSDPAARGMAETIAGARVVPDHDPPRGMNAAVVRGLEAVAAAGADGALVVTADLPLARPGDLDAVVIAAPPGPSVTVAPSWDGTGTNAMLLPPAGGAHPPPRGRQPRPPPRPGRPPRRPRHPRRPARPRPRHRHPPRPGGADGPRRRGGDPGRLRAAGDRRAAGGRERPLRLWPLSALPEVRPGDDLAGMLAARAAAEGVAPGDVLMVAQKVVSKAEGRIVDLAAVTAGPRRPRPGGGDGQGGRSCAS